MYRRLAALSAWSFVVTLLWIGFLLAIGVLETPVRIRTPAVSLADKLAIGHRVFHTLNRLEWLFLVVSGLLALPRSPAVSRIQRGGVVALLAILALQTLLLLTILDQRTFAVIAGQPVSPAPWHAMYIVLDGIKLLLLCGLATIQLRRFVDVIRQPLADS